MHTHNLSGWTMNYNSDFSGTVFLSCEAENVRIEVPFEVLAGFVAEAVRANRRNVLEDASPGELLGLSRKR